MGCGPPPEAGGLVGVLAAVVAVAAVVAGARVVAGAAVAVGSGVGVIVGVSLGGGWITLVAEGGAGVGLASAVAG
jgi:hypothetical protein